MSTQNFRIKNGLTVNGNNYPSVGPLSNRNLIINGDMRIAQRGTGAVTTSGYPVDRWGSNFTTGGAVSLQQSTAVTPDDFGYSIACTVTTADATTDAADQWNVQQYIEGYNIEQLLFGTADAKDVTVSFWVRGSVTGTYCMTLLGSSNGSTLDRSRVSEYTIDSANTWEYKTITVPGDTGGTWTTDNGRGLSVRFGLTAGTNFQQATGSWGATNVVGSSNQTQLLETLNATWYVTGVQLEVGTVATPFEHRSYGQELALCQRYYQKIDFYTGNGQSSSANDACWYQYHCPLVTEMRIGPNLVASTAFGSDTGTALFGNAGAGNISTGLNLDNTTTNSVTVRGNTSVTRRIEGRLKLDSEL